MCGQEKRYQSVQTCIHILLISVKAVKCKNRAYMLSLVVERTTLILRIGSCILRDSSLITSLDLVVFARLLDCRIL